MVENENKGQDEPQHAVTQEPFTERTAGKNVPDTPPHRPGSYLICRNVLFCLSPLIIYLAGSMLITALVTFYFPESLPGRDAASLTTLCDTLLLPVLIFIYRRDGKRGVRTVANRHYGFGKKLFRHTLIFLAGMALSIFSSFLMELFHLDRYFSNAAQEALLSAPPAIQVIGIGMLVPAAEELVFRGLFYSRTKQYLSTVPAAILTAAVFALGHGNVIQMLYAFPMGLILAVVYEKTGSVSGPAACHMGANMISVLVNLLAA